MGGPLLPTCMHLVPFVSEVPELCVSWDAELRSLSFGQSVRMQGVALYSAGASCDWALDGISSQVVSASGSLEGGGVPPGAEMHFSHPRLGCSEK